MNSRYVVTLHRSKAARVHSVGAVHCPSIPFFLALVSANRYALHKHLIRMPQRQF
ncbi:MAG: hypothetical protein ACI9KS_000143 [Sulfitobacter sp.]|jgi:hypothetical protein